MNGQEICSALKEGKRIYGTLIVSTSPRWLVEVKKIGLDFVFIDTEHIAIDMEKLSWMCWTYRGMNLAPIVRIPSPDPYQACKALDVGASGIIAPYVETVEEVKALVGAVKFRPIKGEKLRNVLNKKESFETGLKHYLQERNEGNVLIVNIESTPAVENLESIIKVSGLDAILIGPHDLSCSLGIPEQYRHPQFVKCVKMIIKKARDNNVGVGIHYWEEIEEEIKWIKGGTNLIVHSSDIDVFSENMRTDFQKIKQELGEGGIIKK